jgi:hypothetical protein
MDFSPGLRKGPFERCEEDTGFLSPGQMGIRGPEDGVGTGFCLGSCGSYIGKWARDSSEWSMGG